MKSYIILALLALVSSSFLRELQSTENTQTAQTSSSVLQFPWSNETFDASGNWTLVSTNCTAPTNGDLCIPVVQLAINPANMSILTITLVYPNNPNCGQNAGLTLDVPETLNNGIWEDDNTTSPLINATGIFNFNNFTEMVIQPDVNNPGNNCYQEWANNNSLVTNLSNLTNTFAQWTGVWTPVQWFASIAGQEAQMCCVPSGPVLVLEDLPTQTIAYAWTAPNCTACGVLAGTVIFSNISVLGGGFEDQSCATYPLFGYLIGNGTTVVVVEGLGTCAVQLQLTPANSTCAP
jgi:hypothetical protein